VAPRAVDDSAPLMHIDWIRWFQKLATAIQQPLTPGMIPDIPFTKIAMTLSPRLLGRTTAGAGAAEQIIVTAPLTLAAGALGITGVALTRVDDVNVTLTLSAGAPTALVTATSLTLGWTGTLSAARGGTGFGSYAVGDLLYADTTTTLAKLADVSAGSYLRSGGVGVAPLWSTAKLPNTATTGDVLYASASNVYSNLADVAAGSYLRSGGVTTAPVWSTLTIPNTATTGDLWYASAANTVIARGIGSASDVLTVSGGLPVWSASAPVAATVTIVDDTTTNATMYPTWVTAASGNLPLKVSSTKLALNPSTGILTIGNAPTGTRVNIVGAGGAATISETFSGEANPRWAIGRDLGAGNRPGIGFGPGGATALDAVMYRSGASMMSFSGAAGIFVGMNTITPRRILDVLSSSASQMRLTQTDNSVYTDFQTTSTGDLYINPVGGGKVGIMTSAPGNLLSLGLAGTTRGEMNFAGNTSGVLVLRGPSTASGTLTLPAGTTDFSATGGTAQVVKQTSAGGAFTVATVDASELAGTTLASNVVTSSLTTVGTLGSLTVTGLITANGGILVNGGSFAAGRIYSDGTSGTVISGRAGATYDFRLLNSAGTPVMNVATGTSTAAFAGAITVAGVTTFSNTVNFDGTVNITTNNVLLLGKDTGGTLRGLIGMNNADKVSIASSGNAVLVGGATAISSTLDVSGAVTLTAKVTKYNNVTTAGWGVPAIYGSGRSTAQTAAVASVAAYTVPAADGSFRIDANVLVTTSTTHNFTVAVDYTDEGNTARTLTLTFSSLAGALLTAITNVTGAGPYEGLELRIRCKASTAITVKTVGTFTTVTYNVEATIEQVA